MKMISVKNIVKSYGKGDQKKIILNNINMELKEGDFTIVMGESGSGKTTLLNCLSGLDKVQEGEILFDGKSMKEYKGKKLEELRLHQFGFVFQDNYLIDNLSILENVAITRLQYDANAYEKAEELLTKMHIQELKDKYPSLVSGGEKQRCSIARALVNEPKIIFADEPTAALDRMTADEIMNIFCELNQAGQTILMVTHSPKIAAYGKRMVMIEDGAFVCDEVFENKSYDEKMKIVINLTERKR